MHSHGSKGCLLVGVYDNTSSPVYRLYLSYFAFLVKMVQIEGQRGKQRSVNELEQNIHSQLSLSREFARVFERVRLRLVLVIEYPDYCYARVLPVRWVPWPALFAPIHGRTPAEATRL